MKKTKYKTIFVSDWHLGSDGSKSKEIANWLDSVEAEKIYLVGDIIDWWRLKKRWKWSENDARPVVKILKAERKGTKVIWIAGNHDEFMREVSKFADTIAGIEIVPLETIHECVNGKKMMITHGDMIDASIRLTPWLAIIGSHAYDNLVVISRTLDRIRKIIGLKPWSASKFVKSKVKRAVDWMTGWENSIAMIAKRRGYDGVICGHIHNPEIRMIDGVKYVNCGDWVEHATWAAEEENGDIKIFYWNKE
jgi:UDP-2,3-diacylglucosamine pyrophosphatase LpxH